MDSQNEKADMNTFDLEKDLLLTKEDMEYMNQVRIDHDPDLEKYIDFLMEIGAFDGPYEERTFYDEEFEL